VATWPISINGLTGCWEPIHIKIIKFTTKNQKANFIAGLNWLLLVLARSVKGKIKKINKEPNIATTPNSLLGIDLNIA
jgi:hypothetical protein